MGGDVSSAPLGGPKIKQHTNISHQIIIVLRGSRKTGKTSLLARMKGFPFKSEYKPTPIMQSTELLWTPISSPNDKIKIIVWDVVDHAIQNPNSKSDLPDATTVDTFSRADGLIVLFDPKNQDSIIYAKSVLDSAPERIPRLVVSNFSDSVDENYSIRDTFDSHLSKAFFLNASMKTNAGLTTIAQWLDLPLHISLKSIYSTLIDQISSDLNSTKLSLGMVQTKNDMENDPHAGNDIERDNIVNDKEKSIPLNVSLDGDNQTNFWGSDSDDNEKPILLNIDKPLPKLDLSLLSPSAEVQDNEPEEKPPPIQTKKPSLLKNRIKKENTIVQRPAKPFIVIKEKPPQNNDTNSFVESQDVSQHISIDIPVMESIHIDPIMENGIIVPTIEAGGDQTKDSFWSDDDDENQINESIILGNTNPPIISNTIQTSETQKKELSTLQNTKISNDHNTPISRLSLKSRLLNRKSEKKEDICISDPPPSPIPQKITQIETHQIGFNDESFVKDDSFYNSDDEGKKPLKAFPILSFPSLAETKIDSGFHIPEMDSSNEYSFSHAIQDSELIKGIEPMNSSKNEYETFNDSPQSNYESMGNGEYESFDSQSQPKKKKSSGSKKKRHSKNTGFEE